MAQDWQSLHQDFLKLREEEIRIGQGMQTVDILGMYDSGDEHGVWMVMESPSESLTARFSMLAATAGEELQAPPAVSKRLYWLHRLFHHLVGEDSDHLSVSDDKGGRINGAIEASAIYCAVLKTREIERRNRTQGDYNFLQIKEALQEAPRKAIAIEEEQTPLSDATCPRRKLVDDFLRRCNEHSSTRIIRRHIWLAVGHTKPRQFEYWQSCNEKETTDADLQNFARILGTDAKEFVATLKRKAIIPTNP